MQRSFFDEVEKGLHGNQSADSPGSEFLFTSLGIDFKIPQTEPCDIPPSLSNVKEMDPGSIAPSNEFLESGAVVQPSHSSSHSPYDAPTLALEMDAQYFQRDICRFNEPVSGNAPIVNSSREFSEMADTSPFSDKIKDRGNSGDCNATFSKKRVTFAQSMQNRNGTSMRPVADTLESRSPQPTRETNSYSENAPGREQLSKHIEDAQAFSHFASEDIKKAKLKYKEAFLDYETGENSVQNSTSAIPVEIVETLNSNSLESTWHIIERIVDYGQSDNFPGFLATHMPLKHEIIFLSEKNNI